MSEPVIRFRRADVQVIGEGFRDMEPQTWAPVIRAPWLGGVNRVLAVVCCPYGHQGLIQPPHQVSDEGVVSPSCICPDDGCPWHDYLTLDDWREPWKLVGWES